MLRNHSANTTRTVAGEYQAHYGIDPSQEGSLIPNHLKAVIPVREIEDDKPQLLQEAVKEKKQAQSGFTSLQHASSSPTATTISYTDFLNRKASIQRLNPSLCTKKHFIGFQSSTICLKQPIRLWFFLL